ncbi:MAG: pyrroline-5-carboxylate reductase [Balneolaceae bacterium]
MKNWKNIAIIGAGNIGTSIASGLAASGIFKPAEITLTRRRIELLKSFKKNGFRTTTDNLKALETSDIILLAVEPQQLDSLLDEIGEHLDPERHLLISVITGVHSRRIIEKVAADIPVVRAAPNTAIAIRESMTCISSPDKAGNAVKTAEKIFNTVGETMVILEEQMTAATALCACGIAFFLRSIRAASQGGIEIGFHSTESNLMAAQTAKGAASLLLHMGNHPEYEVDRVTTPRGCTISGLNEMEHNGFSSAMIKGILLSAEKAAKLYEEP